MHRVHHVNIREVARGLYQRLADALEAVAEVFPTVAGDQHHAAVLIEELELLFELGFELRALQLAHHFQQRIDHRVARGVDVRAGDAFLEQVVTRVRGRCEVQRGDRASQATVAFFGPRRIQVVGAQAGFDVGNRDLLVVGREAGRQGRRRIAVDQDHIRLELCQDRLEPLQDCRGDIGQVLTWLHDVQVIVRRDLEQLQHLVEHLAVLAGHAYARLEAIVLSQVEGQRCHFDGLWAGTKYDKGLEGHGDGLLCIE
ncbi:hypothetical protein D3C79_524590 [compost metagenome]